MTGFHVEKRANPTPPMPGDPAIAAARSASAQAAENTFGRQATILTSGEGAPGTPNILKKTLLGG